MHVCTVVCGNTARDRLGKPLQPVHHRDQHVLHPTVASVRSSPAARTCAPPSAQSTAPARRASRPPPPQAPDTPPCSSPPRHPNLHPQRVKKHDRIHRFQRPVLPFRHLAQHRVRHRADEVMAHVHLVLVQQQALNLPHRHPPRIQRDDLLIKPVKAPLPLGNQARLKGAARSRGTAISTSRPRQATSWRWSRCDSSPPAGPRLGVAQVMRQLRPPAPAPPPALVNCATSPLWPNIAAGLCRAGRSSHQSTRSPASHSLGSLWSYRSSLIFMTRIQSF